MKKNQSFVQKRTRTDKIISLNKGDRLKTRKLTMLNPIDEIPVLKESDENVDVKLLPLAISPPRKSIKHQTQTYCIKKLESNIINLHEPKTSQIKVIARFRPVNQYEEELTKKEAGKICVDFISKDTVSITSSLFPKQTYTFDSIFDIKTTQTDFYNEVIKETIFEVLSGYNGTIFTYGQSGSGKTFTMFGADLYNEEKKGIIPRSIEEIFNFIQDPKDQTQYQLTFSILEIYRENIYDLLNPDIKTSDLKIKEDPKKGTYVDNLTGVSIELIEEFFAILEAAEENRSISETRLNKSSSRSHVVFILHIKQKLTDDTEKIGTLNLVDLAGSEKISKTGAVGETLEEAKKINQSLSCLGNVINSLTGSNKDFIPYRESKLTRLLKDSLGGNFKTTLIVNCSPHSYNAEDTISTLNFAKRAKKVKNKVKLNIKRSPEELEKIIAGLQEQLRLANLEILKLSSSSTKENSKNSNFSGNLEGIQVLKFNESEIKGERILIDDSILNEKDQEIAKLKEDIESLRNENKSLFDEIQRNEDIIDISQTLEKIENSIRNNLNFMNENCQNYNNKIENILKNENRILKEKLSLESKRTTEDLLSKLKSSYGFDIKAKEDEFGIKFNSFFQEISKIENCDYLLKSYENILNSSSFLMNENLSDLLKSDFMKNENTTKNEIKNQIPIKDIKSSYLKMSSLVIFYEKIIFELLGKISMDLKNYDLTQSYCKDNTDRVNRLNRNFKDYLDLLEEIKKLKIKKHNKTPTINENHEQKISSYNIIENDNKSKFIKTVEKKGFPKKLTSLNVFNKLNFNKLNEEEERFNDYDQQNLDKFEKIDECAENRLLNVQTVATEGSATVTLLNENTEINNNLNKNRDVPVTQNINEKEDDNKSLLQENINKMKKKKITKMSSQIRNFKSLKTINDYNYDCYIEDISQEIKVLRQEKQMNSNFIQNLTAESSEMQKKIFKYDEAFVEYQSYLRTIHEKEIQNLRLFYLATKSQYLEEINSSNETIIDLNKLIDEMTLDKKLVQSNNHMKKSVIKKRNKILNSGEDIGFNSINSFAEMFLSDSGTASKKLDYIYIDLKNENKDEFDIILGSGISSKTPSKCPLNNNLRMALGGDNEDVIEK